MGAGQVTVEVEKALVAVIRLEAIRAKIAAVKARVEGFKAANIERTQRGASPAYDERHFFQAEVELDELAKEAEQMAKSPEKTEAPKVGETEPEAWCVHPPDAG